MCQIQADKTQSTEEYLQNILKSGNWVTQQDLVDTCKPILSRLCARYVLFIYKVKNVLQSLILNEVDQHTRLTQVPKNHPENNI